MPLMPVLAARTRYRPCSMARMRAIEQGRYLARAANTGISGIVDPYGRVVARSALFEPAVVIGRVRFLDGLTVYARMGDALSYACLALCALVAFWPTRRPASVTITTSGRRGR